MLAEGRARAKAALEQEEVRTWWKAAKYINDDLRLHEGRARYGDEMVLQISADLGVGEPYLYEVLQFQRYFAIPRPGEELTLSHYRALSRIKDSKERLQLFNEALRKKWTVPELRGRISGIASAASQPRNDNVVIARRPKEIPRPPQRGLQKALSLRGHEVAEAISGLGTGSAISASARAWPPLIARRGKFYHYRVIKTRDLHRPSQEILALDLGFRVKHFPSFARLKNPKPGEMVRALRIEESPKGDRYKIERVSAAVSRYYTYKAYVKNVVDNDTQWVDIDLGFHNGTDQKLRLRGIDAAEIEKGKPASDFVKRTLARVPFVVITISGRDKFGRPLADLFYLEGTDDKEKVLREGIFLNQQLLDLGLAKRV